MNRKPLLACLAIAAFLAAGAAGAQTPGTGPLKADREAIKADRAKLKADREKLSADRKKAREERREKRAAAKAAAKGTGK